MNEIRLPLYIFFKVREDSFLHTGPNRLRLPSQKLVFKVKFGGKADPVGVQRGQAPLEFEVFYYSKRFLEVLVI